MDIPVYNTIVIKTRPNLKTTKINPIYKVMQRLEQPFLRLI